jgi:hypothetical protein
METAPRLFEVSNYLDANSLLLITEPSMHIVKNYARNALSLLLAHSISIVKLCIRITILFKESIHRPYFAGFGIQYLYLAICIPYRE